MVVVLVVMALAVLGALLYLAMVGNVWATGILFSGWSILCVVIGWSLSMVQQDKAASKEQQAFSANLKENVTLMAAMQTVQNRQNQGLMSQLITTPRLPSPSMGADGLVIDNAIFDELEAGL